MSKKILFVLSTAVTTCVMSTVLYVNRPGPRVLPNLLSEGAKVYASPQISLHDVARMRSFGIQTIVDMRPDGEASDEPAHLQMEQTAEAYGLSFAYIPVPHESIPPATVKSLSDVLLACQKPVLLYCRTGRRAVRTFALFEASRPGGPGDDTILKMVSDAGFTADDLRPEIETRIAARTTASEAKQ